MKLATLTWKEAAALERDVVVLIPTGSLEQHGPGLPLFTDSLIVTAIAEAVESRLPDQVLLCPTLWLGCSGHHLAFAGTLSASFEAYEGAVRSVVASLLPHGFHRFFALNGHGGNSDSLGVAFRSLKAEHPNATFGHAGYFSYIPDTLLRQVLEGPLKQIRHACEAEVSLVMHVAPGLVRAKLVRDDGLECDPSIRGLIHHFDEATEEGPMGYGTYATAEKGRALFDAAVEAIAGEMESLSRGYVLKPAP